MRCSEKAHRALIAIRADASDTREHGNSIDFRKLDRYVSVIAGRTFAV